MSLRRLRDRAAARSGQALIATMLVAVAVFFVGWPSLGLICLILGCTATILLAIGDQSSRILSSIQSAENLVRLVKHVSVNGYAMHRLHGRFPNVSWSGMSSGSMEPANLLVLLEELDRRLPATVLEFGPGVSSLLITSWMKDRGQGRLVCIEHDEKWLEILRSMLATHGLSEYAELVHAPLKQVECLGHQVTWYDLPPRIAELNAAFAVVDGPPAYVKGHELNRLPALPYLMNSNPQADVVALLDDGDRTGERSVAALWAEIKGVTAVYRPTASGVWVMSLQAGSA